MPTNKHKADAYIKNVSDFARKERERLAIDRADVDLRIRVAINDSVVYDEHEDED